MFLLKQVNYTKIKYTDTYFTIFATVLNGEKRDILR